MPWKDKDYEKEYTKKYNESDKCKAQRKQYLASDKGKAKRKKYQDEHPEMMTISRWKFRGVIDTDFDLLYDYYIKQTNCMICDIKFKDTRDRHLDHDHITGEVRYICCQKCNNVMLGSRYD
tara:strand:+ start:48 stop:410 length:363 start_codon:yes stop_codon:yes gene_type:complete